LPRFDDDLVKHGLSGQKFAGAGAMAAVGVRRANAFADRVRAVMDPAGKFS
jgi:hypothetical protein